MTTTFFNPEDYPGLIGIREFVQAGGLDERDTTDACTVSDAINEANHRLSELPELLFKTCEHCKLPSRNSECDSCYKVRRNRELSAECMVCGDHAINGKLCDDCNKGVTGQN